MKIKALKTFNILYEDENYIAYSGEIKYWNESVVGYILINYPDYIEVLDSEYNEYRRFSYEDKPDVAPKYSILFEMDTSKFYAFNGEFWCPISEVESSE